MHLFVVNFKLSNEMLNLQNGSEEGKMSNIHENQILAPDCLRKGSVVSHFRFQFQHKTKHVRQGLP